MRARKTHTHTHTHTHDAHDSDEDTDDNETDITLASDEPDQKVRGMVLDLSTEIFAHAEEFDSTTAEWLINSLTDLVGEVSKKAEL